MISRLFFIFAFLVCNPFYGQDSQIDALQKDDGPITVKKFEDEFQEEYTGNDFDYEEDGDSENLISKLVRSFMEGMEDLFGFDLEPETYRTIETILYIVLIAIGLYFMVRLLMGQKATAFFGSNNRAISPMLAQEEDISQIDLQALIDNALKQSDYRLAVRYMFLKVLKDLSGRNLIQWHFDKTNNDYLRELSSQQLQGEFRTVSRLYNYIWYGEFPINKERFVKAQAKFDQLQNSIRKHG